MVLLLNFCEEARPRRSLYVLEGIKAVHLFALKNT